MSPHFMRESKNSLPAPTPVEGMAMVDRVVAEQGLEGLKRFCHELTDRGILNGDAIRATFAALDEAHHPTNADELATLLVRDGKLTDYQLKCVKQRRIEGLTLGQYTIFDRIAEGGMGQVLKARHTRMQHMVAIKIISEKILGSADALSRFEQEVRASEQDRPDVQSQRAWWRRPGPRSADFSR